MRSMAVASRCYHLLRSLLPHHEEASGRGDNCSAGNGSSRQDFRSAPCVWCSPRPDGARRRHGERRGCRRSGRADRGDRQDLYRCRPRQVRHARPGPRYRKRLEAPIARTRRRRPKAWSAASTGTCSSTAEDWQLTGLDIKEMSGRRRGRGGARDLQEFRRAARYACSISCARTNTGDIDEIQETLKRRWAMSKILSDALDVFPDGMPGSDDDGD